MKQTTLLFAAIALFGGLACKTLRDNPTSLVDKPSGDALYNYYATLDTHVLGIPIPIFGWEFPKDNIQASYRIVVASSKQKLLAEVGDLWDSGKRYSKEHSGVAYQGKTLPVGKNVWWKVDIWDENDVPTIGIPQAIDSLFAEKQGLNLSLLGGTMIAHMEKYGYLEAALQTQFPHTTLRIRNLGWPADDVFGTARSEFGSALNTASWKPPDPEEGYGFKVLKEHISLVKAQTLILGFGSEAAFADTEKKYKDFVAGYTALLNAIEAAGITPILLSPHKHWQVPGAAFEVEKQNNRLARATQMIKSLAASRGHVFIDLFDAFDTHSPPEALTDNGIHLTKKGYKVLANLILEGLEIDPDKGFSLSLAQEGTILKSHGAHIDGFLPTQRGFRFTLQTDKLHPLGELTIPAEHILKIDGHIQRGPTGDPYIHRSADSVQLEELRAMIIEKNRLHRFRINPLNKVYTHLFRQHEMGHLAYETDDYARLTEEKDELISLLRVPKPHRYEVELLDAWVAPRVYPDHEVPSFIPEPDVQAELAAFTVAEGFELNLFASDPMVANPISLTWDKRGRAWVGTSSTYPQIKPGLEPIDKIVILEDTDKDGVADKHTIFAEGILIPHSVMPVDGGAYVTNTTELLFMHDYDGDDKADETRVIYSGFGHGDVHHTIHSTRWSPWGDLYFSQSININSFVETPYGFRKLNGSGFWQFRPETERLEIFSRGMINPWGQAFDEWGQCFATDGAGGSGPHYLYPGSAHITAVGSEKVLGGLMNGKPKNTAAEILSGPHIPNHWQGSLLASDFRANRTVRYTLTEKGSGYAAEEAETVLHSSHRSYRPVDIKQGPDGAVYIVDWYSPIIDHGEVDFYHPSRDKSHGRIWRLTAKGKALHTYPHIEGASILELLDQLKAPDHYTRLQANRELVSRNCPTPAIEKWVSGLSKSDPNHTHHQLEALWLGAALNRLDKDLVKELSQSKDHRVRAAALRMVSYGFEVAEGESLLAEFVSDPHPQVRLEAINALRRLASPQAAHLAMKALDHPIDKDLDFMLWLTIRELEAQWLPNLQAGKAVFEGDFERMAYALKAINNPEATAALAKLANSGQLKGKARLDALDMIARLGGSEELDMVLREASQGENTALLEALVQAPSSNTAKPNHTEALASLHQHSNPKVRTLTAQLYGRWKISSGKEALFRQVSHVNNRPEERLAAAEALVSLGELGKLKELARSHSNPSIRSVAIAAWAKVDQAGAMDPAMSLITQGQSLEASKRIFNTYCRLKGGAALLEEKLAGKTLNERTAIAGIRIAQSSGRNMESLVQVLQKAGDLQPVGFALDDAKRKQLLADVSANGNRWRGRQVYYRPSLLCATCHEVAGEGGKVGPSLSTLGSYMTPASILESLINPNTDLKQGYETVIVTKTDGTVISGTLSRKTESAALVRDATGKIIAIPNTEVEKMEVSPISLMPPGLTAPLRYDELVDLMAFLISLGK